MSDMSTPARLVVINELLCFLTRKFGRYPAKQMKALMFDFYPGEVISAAKEVLLEAVDALKVIGAPKVVRKRRDSKENQEAKVKLDIDDLMSTITFLDDSKLIDRLPIFVAADPNLIPSPRLLEGDMMAVLMKLGMIEQKCASLQAEGEYTRSLIAKLPTCVCKSGPTIIKKPINKALQSIVGGKSGASQAQAKFSVSEVESACSARESDEEAVGSDGQGGFTKYESHNARRLAKKRQRLSTPPDPPSTSYAAKAGPHPSSVTSAPATAAGKAGQGKGGGPQGKRILIGHSTTSTMKAAKSLNLPKAFYRIGNIDGCYTADDLRQYIEGLDVRVLSCFDRTSEKSRYVDNKTFRVCIYVADKNKLLCDGNWSVGISIQKWIFKPRTVGAQDTGVKAGAANTVEADVFADCSAALGDVMELESAAIGTT